MTGSDILAAAEAHLGDQYRLGARSPFGVAHRGPWDCAELVSHVVHQVTGELWGCADNHPSQVARADAYSGWWARDAAANPIGLCDASTAPAGAILIRAPAPKANVGGHVAITDGRGGTVEAHSTARGVCRSTVAGRRWDYCWRVSGVEYSTPAPLEVDILRHGSRGANVRRVQTAIGITPDGLYGVQTTRAVVAWQAAHGLTPDGEVGPLTWAALFPDGS